MTNTAKLTATDIANAAKRLGVEPAKVKAVITVESSGGGFMADGRVKVNFEPHIMYRRLKHRFGQVLADEALAKYPDLVATHSGHTKNLSGEDTDMDRAATLIDRNSALESASWGMFQIMGYHWQTLKMVSVQEFVNLQYAGEVGQLKVFEKFIQASPRALSALRRGDWAAFAFVYNGPNFAEGGYDVKLLKAYLEAKA